MNTATNAPAGNRLSSSTSPYLQQHAHNPVDWWPWCAEALQLAATQDKPILLSIGYSACHWCHVMAHESFEDSRTADLMNRLFVNVKVDREERPDLDKIYQSAHQLLAQRPGGWPLTMFLTPDDRIPFFGGTYFPPEPRHGLPGFRDLLRRIERAYREQGAAIRAQNRSMSEALGTLNPTPATGTEPDTTPLRLAEEQLARNFDREHGGFGSAPKFPHPTTLEFLLRRGSASADPQTLHMVVHTLERMALGGINDQLGGGFCRYSVDPRWAIPHFEKMLYDNGPLLALYCDAWQATGRPLFRATASAVADWVQREMQAPDGGYYSSLDADSEGEEGRFYVWEREQAQALLEPDEQRLLVAHYGLDRPPNFENRWHLRVTTDRDTLAERFGLDRAQLDTTLDGARRKLLAARERRIRPGRDDKILTSWNALMIKGMARAARVLARPDCLASAERALACIRTTLWRDGRLLATCKDNQAHLMAYLDDHAFLLDALLELLQTRWQRTDLELAITLADTLLDRFQDPAGGFWFTADDHEPLIHRPKPLTDDATPSGNGVAVHALLRLGHLLGEPRYLEAAELALRLAWEPVRQLPYAHCGMLQALEEWLEPGETLVVRADPGQDASWRDAMATGYAPRRLALLIPGNETALPGLLGERAWRPGGVAYRCLGTRCDAPITSPRSLVS